ncbi:FAD-dependent monooxygenase [Chitinophaga cymbidii]|uniref:FAD-binding domain-containing protein n=1 Tax=Chitinophaga cymbidii TaxID=1096750 RepID=A0A512RJK2_9BACT|nr:FAD-dependent monooxygenase [Chitinophaga cymbidii]GEP95889.1 hypothetical protein CCY01nite_21490 [Chitinophaga cymbidii]
MKVIIIGAGIGGLTTAIALQQRGIAYEIYDAAPGNRPVGAGIMLGANAMRVYERLEIAEEIKSVSVLAEYIYIRNCQGTVLQTISNAEVEERYGTGTYGLHRAALQQVLLGHCRQPVHYNKRCASVSENGPCITVHFSDGSKAEGSLVIGADGIRSAVREQCVEKARYRYSGQTCWRAIIPVDLPAAEASVAAETWSVKGGGLRAMFTQVGPQQVYFWMTKAMPAGTVMPPEAALPFIREQLSGYEGYMQAMLHHLRPEYLIQSDLSDIAPLRSWHKGRAVLLGDAAHATTPNVGQGAGLAIEDAWVLVQCLAASGHHEQAFEAYQQRRMARAGKIVRLSRQIGWLTNWKGRLLTGLRDSLMKRMPKRMTDKQLAFFYGVDLDA